VLFRRYGAHPHRNLSWRYITHMRKRFLDTSFIDMLRAHNIALVVAETARRWPMTHDVTATSSTCDCMETRSLSQRLGDKALDKWACRIEAWHRGSEPRTPSRSRREPPTRKARDVPLFDNTDVAARARRRATADGAGVACASGRQTIKEAIFRRICIGVSKTASNADEDPRRSPASTIIAAPCNHPLSRAIAGPFSHRSG
jgi:hypothetical protein